MAVKLCQHILESGKLCQCPALRGRRQCYSHSRQLKRQMGMARSRARSALPAAKEREEVGKILYVMRRSLDFDILHA